MPSRRIAIMMPAHLASTRLPRKMLTDIAGWPALRYPLERMKMPARPDCRILCTTVNPDDDEIVELGKACEWDIFRGSEIDVLSRYLGAAESFDVEFMVNVDGDDLFCSQEYVDRIIEQFQKSEADYISCEGLPFGGAPIGVKIRALRDVCERKGEDKTEGWGKYFLQSGQFHVETLQADERVRRPQYRMSLDYPEDLEFFRKTVESLDPGHRTSLSLPEIVTFLDAHPEVAAISQVMMEEYMTRFHREHGAFTMKPTEGTHG